MAKELPYFQFEPAEYLTRDISFCSLSAQGLFINVCAYYWQRQCELTRTQFLRRLNHEKELNELVQEGIIDLIDDTIKIKFLDVQFCKATSLSKTNSSNGSKGGRPKKENPTESESKANQNPTESESESESKGIREEKIKENEIKTPPTPKGEVIIWNDLITFFNNTFEKKSKVVPEAVQKKYNQRLKEGYLKTDISKAMVNASKDSYHIETGFKHLTLEFFSRPDKLDKFCSINPEPIKRTFTPMHNILDHD